MMEAIDSCPAPLVAPVQGFALGGGSGLVACSDIAIAHPDATFGFTEVRLGIIPAVISPFVFAKIGAAAARRFFLTGERFDAHDRAANRPRAGGRGRPRRGGRAVRRRDPQVRARLRHERRNVSRASTRWTRKGSREPRRDCVRATRAKRGCARSWTSATRAGSSETAALPRRRGRPRRHDVLRGAHAAAAALRGRPRALEGRRRRPRAARTRSARSSPGSPRACSRRASASSRRCSSGSAA